MPEGREMARRLLSVAVLQQRRARVRRRLASRVARVLGTAFEIGPEEDTLKPFGEAAKELGKDLLKAIKRLSEYQSSSQPCLGDLLWFRLS